MLLSGIPNRWVRFWLTRVWFDSVNRCKMRSKEINWETKILQILSFRALTAAEAPDPGEGFPKHPHARYPPITRSNPGSGWGDVIVFFCKRGLRPKLPITRRVGWTWLYQKSNYTSLMFKRKQISAYNRFCRQSTAHIEHKNLYQFFECRNYSDAYLSEPTKLRLTHTSSADPGEGFPKHSLGCNNGGRCGHFSKVKRLVAKWTGILKRFSRQRHAVA